MQAGSPSRLLSATSSGRQQVRTPDGRLVREWPAMTYREAMRYEVLVPNPDGSVERFFIDREERLRKVTSSSR